MARISVTPRTRGIGFEVGLIVDRLTFGGNVIETGTDSYRLAHAKTQQSTN